MRPRMAQSNRLAALIQVIASHPRVAELGLTKLWKLIYFIETEALRERGTAIVEVGFTRMPRGPVPIGGDFVLDDLERSGAISMKQVQHGPYTRTDISPRSATAPRGLFTKDEVEIIDRVCKKLGRVTATKLSTISHLEPAWKSAVRFGELDPVLMRYGPKEDPEGL